MTYEVVMPQLGLTMEEGSVVSWKKQVGDRVTKGEVLFTVETDKTEMEVESADSGYLNSLQVRLGEKVRVGTVIALLGDRPGEVAVEGCGPARPKPGSMRAKRKQQPTPSPLEKPTACFCGSRRRRPACTDAVVTGNPCESAGSPFGEGTGR